MASVLRSGFSEMSIPKMEVPNWQFKFLGYEHGQGSWLFGGRGGEVLVDVWPVLDALVQVTGITATPVPLVIRSADG